jgi:hypothetical protein
VSQTGPKDATKDFSSKHAAIAVHFILDAETGNAITAGKNTLFKYAGWACSNNALPGGEATKVCYAPLPSPCTYFDTKSYGGIQGQTVADTFVNGLPRSLRSNLIIKMGMGQPVALLAGRTSVV